MLSFLSSSSENKVYYNQLFKSQEKKEKGTHRVPRILAPKNLRERIQSAVSFQLHIASVIRLLERNLPAGTCARRLNVYATIVCRVAFELGKGHAGQVPESRRVGLYGARVVGAARAGEDEARYCWGSRGSGDGEEREAKKRKDAGVHFLFFGIGREDERGKRKKR